MPARSLVRRPSPPLGALVAALCASLASATQDEGRGWSWETLDLDVWIEPELRQVHIEGAGRLRLDGERSSGPVLLLNARLLELLELRAEGGTVALGTRPLGEFLAARAQVTLATPAEHGARLAVEFACDGLRFDEQFALSSAAALASWTRGWYPVPDGGPSAALSRLLAAPGVTRFHLPEGWNSVSNGTPEASDEPGVECWRVTQPVARSFACAPFTHVGLDVDGREVAIHRLRSAPGPGEAELRAIAGILRALEGLYGPYPYPGYRVVEVPAGVGDFLGSSEQGFILVRSEAFGTADGNLALFGHEMAHGWWGNRVSGEGSGSILLSEGLAQYSAVAAIEVLEGREAATDFLRFSRPGYVAGQCARGYFEMLRAGSDWPLAELSGGGAQHQLVDAKGHWVLRMLEDRVGRERFLATLRALVRDFTQQPLTLAEFRARFEAAAPEADLARFFHDWLDRAGAPVLEARWIAGQARPTLEVHQLQPGEPYRLELEVALQGPDGPRSERLDLGERTQRFELPAADGTTPAVLDPHHRLLIWTSDYGPAPERVATDGR